jgi:hypothetical protein
MEKVRGWTMREASMAVVVAGFVVLAAVGFGGGFIYAQFTDTETKQVSVSAGTWTTTPEETPAPSQHAISFVAFCVADGTDPSVSAVDITNVERGDDGEPVAVEYMSTFNSSTVVLFGGGEFENFEGWMVDTVHFGNGTTPESAGTGKPGRYDQMQAVPYPSGETQVIKYNYDDNSDAFVEDGTESPGSTRGIKAQSVENTTTETSMMTSVGTATATETETAASTETETETATATATPTATSSPTPTETETTAAATVNGTDQREGKSIGNETAGTDADA